MATSESKNKRLVDFKEISQDSEELYEIMLEYFKLRVTIDEPADAKNLRETAERYLTFDNQDYDMATKFMKAALAYLKAYSDFNQSQ
jgi:hypothetical protein